LLRGVKSIRPLYQIGSDIQGLITDIIQLWASHLNVFPSSRSHQSRLLDLKPRIVQRSKDIALHITVDSINLVEYLLSLARGILSHADQVLTRGTCPPYVPTVGAIPIRQSTRSSDDLQDEGDWASEIRSNIQFDSTGEWAIIERGATPYEPRSLSEASSHATECLRRAMSSTGAIAAQMTSNPSSELASEIVSVARLLPSLILRPFLGLTEAVTVTLQGTRNQLYPTFRDERDRKFRGPSITFGD